MVNFDLYAKKGRKSKITIYVKFQGTGSDERPFGFRPLFGLCAVYTLQI